MIADPREAALSATTIVIKDDRILRLVSGHVGAENITEKAEGDQVKIIDLKSSTILPCVMGLRAVILWGCVFWQRVQLCRSWVDMAT